MNANSVMTIREAAYMVVVTIWTASLMWAVNLFHLGVAISSALMLLWSLWNYATPRKDKSRETILSTGLDAMDFEATSRYEARK